MKHNDTEHLKQNVPIFILHRQILTLIFIRDSSFISPRDFLLPKERIKDNMNQLSFKQLQRTTLFICILLLD